MWKLIWTGWLAAIALMAQTAPVREVNILVGRVNCCQFERDLVRIVIAERRSRMPLSSPPVK